MDITDTNTGQIIIQRTHQSRKPLDKLLQIPVLLRTIVLGLKMEANAFLEWTKVTMEEGVDIGRIVVATATGMVVTTTVIGVAIGAITGGASHLSESS